MYGDLIVETPDILNSKIKKIRIELPDYKFSHSASGDSTHTFIGRERIREKLKRLVEDSPDEPGVYLVAGNRGVGKTSLVSEVIKDTSLRQESNFFKDLKSLFDIKKYIKNHNRLYLRINFGHKLKDEKDIFRLIARTLSTEYAKYRRSFIRMLPWRTLALCVLFLVACLFGTIVLDSECLYNVSSAAKTTVEKRIENKIKTKDGDVVETSVETKTINHSNAPCFDNKENIKSIVNFIYSSDILFLGISFLIMYLLCILIFRSIWIMPFLVTHRTIARRLKKLNNDITHSTERENMMGVNSGGVGTGIGIRTRKSRDVADAREIEKELLDVLSDMRRIPPFMCRPNVVIVFDELDKVEPGDTGSEKERQQTKATIFSIGATRERQTEILRILSNLKYFLSTARAKFIFIAGREMFDIHLADVSERNNYIGSIFNVVIHVPSFLTDHPKGKKSIREESGIASLPEEFVCRRLFPRNYKVKLYNLKSYRVYLEEKIFIKGTQEEDIRQKEIQKIIAILQQFIIYLAHISKGAPKKMMQLLESFVEIRDEKDKNKRGNTLIVQRNRKSKHFLTFNYYKQYSIGVIAYLITPILHRLAESNIKEHSDKLLVSTLRFVDFLFKFHKHSFSWKHLEISPEMLEANRAPELKSVVVDLLNYLAQVHINKSSFSLYDYRFDSWIANEIFTMTKTDEVFSALFSFSLDETLSLKKYYQDMLEKAEKEYQYNKEGKTSIKYIDAISSLQIVLGDLYYYDDELEVAAAHYKNAVEMINKNEDPDKNAPMDPERLYLYVRNKLKLGMIHERRKQYDFAYLTYGGICKRIIHERNTAKSSLNNDDSLFNSMTFEGLKQLYLPFIAKLQMLEQSHMGGITYKHLEQLEQEHDKLTFDIDPAYAVQLNADFYSRVADVLYYKNSDLGYKLGKNIKYDDDVWSYRRCNKVGRNLPTNSSCTACYYYHKSLSILLNLDKTLNNDIKTLLCSCVKQLNRSSGHAKEGYNMKYYTILARILSDWGNVFFSCDSKNMVGKPNCYICGAIDSNTHHGTITYPCSNCNSVDCKKNSSVITWKRYVNYVCSALGENGHEALVTRFETGNDFTKMEIAIAMYSISSEAYRRANLYKRSSFQIYKMLRLLKFYEIYKCKKSMDYIEKLSKKAIHYLWYANEDLNILELNKRKKDFDKTTIIEDDMIPLQNLLVDGGITKIRVLVKELELKSHTEPSTIQETLKKFYGLYITSPYKINYSIGGRIYRLRLKSKVNYEAYKKLINNDVDKPICEQLKIVFGDKCDKEAARIIFGKFFGIDMTKPITDKNIVDIFENIVADSIYGLIDIVQLSKTMGETYVFTNSFLGSVHEHLCFWIRLYETYEQYLKTHSEIAEHSRIKDYLKKYLDDEWREMLSGYRENQRALSHYYQALEMHSEGRAYHDMIDTMCYVRDDYNDRSDHFNIAEERHLIVNGIIDKKIKDLKDVYKKSKLYDVDNYFEQSQ